MHFLNNLKREIKNYNIFRKNFVILFDVSSILSNFAIPYVKNLFEYNPKNNNVLSPKHGKLAMFPIKILITPTIIGLCASKLNEKKFVKSIGMGHLAIESLCEKSCFENNPFILRKSVDSNINGFIIDDFNREDGSREDSIHICTANYYGTPIVTNESKKIDLWRERCKYPVLINKQFWEFIHNLKKGNYNVKEFKQTFYESFS